ncbi:MAG: Gfo/Idh/MocA family oxidoreductase [Vicinamibacterales bacterium]|jgi:predicted dehydrogenase|nr:Gfo/Idh/MocA family oxidoreductase [Vicinamibacterales bacterium]
MDRLRWGVLSTAKIAREKVIPAMQKGTLCEVVAIASRDAGKAREVAGRLGIPTIHGRYEDLLADPAVDAVYNPLPNHLHVPLTLQALRAGKHVLCEKPIALTATEARALVEEAASHPRLKVMEAFMYRFHPQWLRAKALVASGAVGEVRAIDTVFTYHNVDPGNIRNRADLGGGGLMDIGCYPVSQARFLLGAEPGRVLGRLEIDPAFGTDRVASAMLDFGHAVATFTVSTQLSPYQRVQVLGTRGRIEIEIPVNAPPDVPARLWVREGDALREETFPACDQYTLQGDAFARAVLEDTPVPTPLSDAVANMRVIDAVTASHRDGGWVVP